MVSQTRHPSGTELSPLVVAFVAATSGTGRTSMVANIAWLMASVGHRVLAVDWGTEQPTLHNYLRHFADDAEPDVSDDLLDAIEAAIEQSTATGRGRARRQSGLTAHGTRYALPGLPAAIDVINCGDLASAPDVYLAAGGARDLRAACQASGYDYVLIDLPTADPDCEVGAITELCDVAVVNFLPRRDGPGRAEELVRTLHDTARGNLSVVAVPSVFDSGAAPSVRQDSNLVRRTFKDLLREPAVRLVEVPYRPQHAVFEAMAVLVDEPGQPDTLVTAYERVAEVITAGAVTAQRPVAPQVRSRYRVALGMAEPEDTVWLAYATQDRLWADWIAEQVRASGLPVRRLSSDGLIDQPGGTVIAVLTASFAGSPAYDAVLAAGAGGDRRAIGVLVAGDVAAEPGALAEQVNLFDLDPQTAHRRLLSAAWIFEPAAAGPLTMPMPRVSAPVTLTRSESQPGSTQPQLTDQPSPSPRFVGREGLLERLRDKLCPLDGVLGKDGMRGVLVTGAPGVGKSELARAYARRFAGMYERVWWIPAGDRQAVRSRLTDLAEALNVPRSDEPAEAALAGLERLSTDTRWLLVYDNAQPDAVDGLLPAGGAGDVVVTAATGIPGFSGATLLVDALDEVDGWALLRDSATGLPQLSDDDARGVAGALGYLPVALILGAAWLRDRNAFNRRSLGVEQAAAAAATGLLDSLAEQVMPARTASPVHRMLALSMHTLAQARSPFGPLAVGLARMCVFLSADGVPLRLLRAQPTLAELAELVGAPGESLLRDEMLLDRVLWTGVRFGLFEVDQANPAVLRIHRVIQEALRRLTEPATLTRAQAATLHSLARYNPAVPESDPRRTEDLADLQAHFEASGVVGIDFADPDIERLLGPAGQPGSKSWAVRRWLVNQIRYLFRLRSKESWLTASTIADKVSRDWTAAFGDADELTGRLDAQRANIYRSLGDPQRALDIDTRLLRTQRRELGRWHPRTLMTARGFGGDLRALGRFEEALAEDEATWLGFTQTFGDDHPETLMVAYNLAVSRHLMGRVPDALALEQAGYDRRARVLGVSHVWTIQSRRALATYLSELGRYDEALRQLQGNLDTLKRFHPRHEHTEELRTARVRLTVLRRKGDAPPDWIRAQGAQLLDRYHKRFGEDSMLTPACRLSHAMDLHADGRSPAAIELARQCVAWVNQSFGQRHPFSSATLVNLALIQHSAGHLGEALAVGHQALTDLGDKLDPLHPWTLAAAVNHAYVLASAGHPDTATDLLGRTRDRCVEYLSVGHPITAAAEHNLAIHRRAPEAHSDGKSQWRELDIDLN